MAKYRLGSLLIQKGFITADQLAAALTYQQQHSNMPIGVSLVELGYIQEQEIERALRRQSRIRFCTAAVTFIMAPFHFTHASDDIEQLPEYKYTQVHEQSYFDSEHSRYSAKLGSDSLDLINITSSALWYVFNSGMDTEKLASMPVRMSLSTTDSSNALALQLSVEF